MLAHSLTQGTTVAVVGSGCSVPLGYPTWARFAAEIVDLTLDALDRPGAAGSSDIERARRFQSRLGTSDPPKAEELMFFIGACRRMVEGAGSAGLWERKLGDLFRSGERVHGPGANPHRSLVRLPITRFVTTNYDCEIERALCAERGIDWERFGISAISGRGEGEGQFLSFTQRAENCDQLALFALARLEGAENMVFHCHGRFDDPGSLIASEIDYQKWYLGAAPESPPFFLQTIDLLFASNPILFVGYGLGDEDLLLPLRRLGAAAPERRAFRPLFALLPEGPDRSESDYHERLFERYGLNVIPYYSPDTSDPQARGSALCSALEELAANRQEWRDGWQEKPRFRRVSVGGRRKDPYRHYSIEPSSPQVLGERRVARKVAALKALAIDGARAIVLVGPGGTGKSWHAAQLLEALQETEEFESFFFWSSYYADDALTGLDRLLAHLDREGDRKASRLARIRETLARGRHAIVFDGFERLLSPTEDPQVGASNDPIVKKFLEICSDSSSKSTLIVTSRLWPKDLAPEAAGIEEVTLERLRTDDLASVDPFSRLNRDQVSTLCSLLDGHAYAALLAAQYLDFYRSEDLEERFVELRRALAATPSDRRLARMIHLVLGALDARTSGLAHSVLERLAVFMSPVTEPTVETCFALAAQDQGVGTEDGSVSARQVADQLLAAQLMFRVVAGSAEPDPPAFTVHPTVRSYVFQGLHRVERDVLPNFTLAGFTSGKASVYPGDRRRAKLVTDLFFRLHEEAKAKLAENRREEAAQLCRSLFGIARSRMEANTAPLWISYQDYLQFGLRVIDLVKALSRERWTFRERHERDEIEDATAPLYADEIAFVYNDLGLALCAEGYMYDTLDVWEQGYEINRLLEGTAEVPLYTLQSQLHLGHTFIEIGKLRIASQYLEETARTNFAVKDVDYGARILGYQGLVAHYRNHLEEADDKYESALRALRAAGGNARAESFFLCHRSKLAIAREEFGQAEKYVRSSRALAQTGEAEDLVAYARAATGRWYREQRLFTEANAEYGAALATSRKLGIHRLETEILLGLSRTALLLGDGELARQRAMASLALANELGLGLRVTQSLLALGLATRAIGQSGLASAYLELARELGDRQEYWLRSREAERALAELGEGGARRSSKKDQME